MRDRRNGVEDPLLANGPGKLTQALGITRELDGAMMARSSVRVYPTKSKIPIRVEVSPRIGISKAVDWPLRFSTRLP